MFLAMLNNDQQRAFAVLADRLVAADGTVNLEEREALRRLRAELRIAETDLDERDETALAAVFDSRRSRVVALLELLGLAYSDHEFHLDEQSMITTVAHEMRLSADELAELNGWVQGYVRHIEAAFELMVE